MTIKLAVLRSGEDIISDIELINEDSSVGYYFNNPKRIFCNKKPILVEENENPQAEFEITLSPWIVLSNDNRIPVRPDWIVTMVEPVSILKEMYEEQVNG
jgi:hypothetical protein